MNLRNMSIIALLLILIASLSTQIMGADEATFNLEQDDKTFKKLVKEMAWNLETPYPYGNWYGPGWWGGGKASDSPGTRAPVDELDSVAMRHDFAYQIAEEQGKIHGPAEEQRLKALADAIAVRDAKALPEDPRDWDPPAADPSKADRYRRRIGFGFAYTAAGRGVAAGAGKLFTSVVDGINGTRPESGRTSGFTEADINRMARERSQKWFETTKITETYRIELTSPQSLLAEGEAATITLKVLPVSSTATAESDDALELFTEIVLDVDGPGSLSSSVSGASGIVTVTATDPWFFSNVGKIINVSGESRLVHFAPTPPGQVAEGGMSDQDIAEEQEYIRSIQILEGSIDFQVALKTKLEFEASPNKISEWPDSVDDPCVEVTLFVSLLTEKGIGVEAVPVTFTLPDGSTVQATTDNIGHAAHTLTLCQSALSGSVFETLTYRASTPKATSEDGWIYFPSSASTAIQVDNPSPKMLRGTVFDQMHNNKPISGATVAVEAIGEVKTVTTGSDGRFVAEFDPQSETELHATVTVTAEGYHASTVSGQIGGGTVSVGMDPVAAVLTSIVLDAESGKRIDGAIVRVTQPFSTTVEANNGQATIHGFYVGDTVSISAGGFNHKTYQKTGVVTAPDVTITFNLPVGEGEMAGGDLDPTEVDPEDLPILHSLTIWATPANPGPGQNVSVTGQIFPPEPGIPIKLEIVGTDGYSNSVMSMTNAMGQAYLPIPGGGMGVVDRVMVLIIGENVRKRLNYSF